MLSLILRFVTENKNKKRFPENATPPLVPSMQERRINALLRSIRRNKKAFIGSIILIVIGCVAALAPLISPYDPFEMQTGPLLQGPTLNHPMGTDIYGRDVFSRVIHGSRISLKVGAIVLMISLVGGLFLGLVAGYYKGVLDIIIMRVADTLFAIPTVLMALVFATIIGPGLNTVIISLSITYMPQYLRIIRGTVLSVREKEFVEAARLSGENSKSIIFRYIFPNSIAPVIVQSVILMSYAILDEAALSYLGLGTQPPTPSWGLMLSEGSKYLLTSKYLTVFPAGAIVFAVLGFNLLGDSLRDILDPRYRYC